MDKENIIEELFLNIPKNSNEKIENYERIINEIKHDSCINYMDTNPDFLKNVLNECNALAFDKALEMILTYLELSDIGKRNMKSESLTIIEKCFKQSRLQTKNFGIDILLSLAEKHTSEIIEILLTNISSNKPKIVNGILETLIKMVKYIKPFPLKEIAKQIPNVIDSRDKMSRDLTKKLAIEISTYFGRHRIEPFLKDIKPILLNELLLEFDKVIPNIEVNQSDSDDVTKPVVDLLSKIPSNFYEKIDGSRQDRKEALDNVLEIIDNSPLVNGNYRELVKKLCYIMTKDSQIPTVAVAVKILTQIAIGLKRNFSQYAVGVFESCLEKFKEKKPIVLSATRECIDATFITTSFDNCSQLILKAIENKNPTIRMETLSFLLRIAKTPIGHASLKKNFKSIMPELRKTCDDMDKKVREQTFQLIGELISMLGDKQINSFLENIDPSKMQLIKSFVSQSSNPIVQESIIVHEEPKLSIRQNVEIVKESVAEVSKKQPTKPQLKLTKEVLISEQELMEKYVQLLGKEVVDKFVSQVWKNRIEACDKVFQYVESHEIDRMSCQIITQLILIKPGLRDSNIMVVRKRLQILQEIFRKCNNGPSILISQICLGEIVEKIGDVKLGAYAKETISVLISTMPDFVNQLIVQCLHQLVESKSIRSVTENIDWLIEYLSNHGSKSLVVKDVLPLVRQLLSSSNSTVKQNTIILIGVLYKTHGKCIPNYFESEKPAIVGMISNEVNKIDKTMKEMKSKIELADVKSIKENHVDDRRCFKEASPIYNSIAPNGNAIKDSLHVNNLSLDTEEFSNEDKSITDDYDRAIKDSCRSFVLEICDKLAVYTDQYSTSLFQKELNLFFSSMKAICDPKMKSSINILLTSLQNSWIDSESVSTQTVTGEIVEENSPKFVPVFDGFVNMRRNRRAFSKIDKENVAPLAQIDNHNEIGSHHSPTHMKDAHQDCVTPLSMVTEIIRVLENENSSYIIYENLSKLKRILKDDSKNQIHNCIPELITSLSKRARFLANIVVPSSVQELIQIVAIINSIYSKPDFVQLITEPVLSSLYTQLFSILASQKFQSIDIFVTLRKSISSLILDITTSSSSTEVLCSMLRLLSLAIDDSTNQNVYINVLIKNTLKILDIIKTNSCVDLDFSKILKSLNQPFVDFADDSEKIGSMAFKTIKTIVDVLTKKKKLQLLDYLPDNNDQLTKYIYRCFNRINGQ